MLILVINCGSSSVKYNLFDIEKKTREICKGVVERIGEKLSILTYEARGGKKLRNKILCSNHPRAIEMIKDMLIDARFGALKDVTRIKGIGHRIVHGGEKFSESVLVDTKVLNRIEKFSPLAPLHNPAGLKGIKSCIKRFKDTPQVAVFDTAFHQSMARHVFCYGIPYKYYGRYGIRKYGFHGTSHRYVSYKAAELLKKPLKSLNLVTVHLGNGSSIAAVMRAKSVDTSMGFTPLEGLVMGTRSGDLDPAIVTFLMQKEGLSITRINDILNKESGLKGVSGISNDMRDILKAIAKGSARARLAYDMFVYRIIKYIGSYAAILGRVDAVIFTAGIGENVPKIKNQIARKLKPLLGSKTKFLTISTNEELLIAQDTYRIVSEKEEVRSGK